MPRPGRLNRRFAAPCACLVLAVACEGGGPPPPGPTPDAVMPLTTTTTGGTLPTPSLLLTQAQFDWEVDAAGKKTPKPGPAKLVVLTPKGTLWQPQTLQDPESRVFHKAICLGSGAQQRLLTIGGTDAHLKTWTRGAAGFTGTSHWNPKFGGKWDRLRDVEIGDIDGDGQDELVLATHDQGVIAVVEVQGGVYQATEIFRRPETFIHEIELGDTDHDGRLEIFATPSEPNKADLSQGGEVMVFSRNPSGAWDARQVAAYAKRHAKEILVDDLDGDGQDELYVSLEARTEKGKDGKRQVLEPLAIQRYTRAGAAWKNEAVAVLPAGIQARVLLVGDLTGRGKPELVVTTMEDGIWRLTPAAAGPWAQQSIDHDSSGFEHAAALADMDGDQKPELYVAADNQDQVRRYVWNGSSFDRETIMEMNPSDLTWSIEVCR